MTRHVRQSARLVHLAPAGVGRADPGDGLRGVRRGGADDGDGREGGGGVRPARRRRVVRARRSRSSCRRARLPVVRRHARSSASATSSTCGSTRAPATRRCSAAPRELPLAGRPLPRGHATSTAAGSRARCWSASGRAAGRRTAGRHPRLRRGRAGTQDVEVARQHDRAAGGHQARAAPRSCGCGRRWWTTGRRCGSAKEILARVVEAYRKIRNTLRILLANLYDFDPAARRACRSAQLEESRPLRARALRRRGVARAAGLRGLRLPGGASQAVNSLVTVDLSAFYVDVSKDRLYTFGAEVGRPPLGADGLYIMVDGLARLSRRSCR